MGDGALRPRVLLVRVSRGDSGLFWETSADEKRIQVGVVSFHFVVGSYESGGHHGMGDRLVIRECHFSFHAAPPPLIPYLRF